MEDANHSFQRSAETVTSESDEDTIKTTEPTADKTAEEKIPYIGTILRDKYEITELVGGGGAGLVFKAKCIGSDAVFAVKMVSPQVSFRADSSARFSREAQSAGLLDHPNIVAVHDFGTSKDGALYLIMDFVNGVNLDDEIKARDGLSLEELIDVFVQVCRGVEHAHARGIVHRDLKPGNIMLTKAKDGTTKVKVVDFGLAKAVANEPGLEKLTQTGEVFGTPSYMSPEQCRGEPIDFRSDIYSMGALIFEALTGGPPFVGKDPLHTIMKQINDAPPKLPPIGPTPDVQSGLQRTVLKALAKNPDQRYQTMGELRQDLEELFGTKKSAAKRAATSWDIIRLRCIGVIERAGRHKRLLIIAVPTCLILGASITVASQLLTPLPNLVSANTNAWSMTKKLPSNTVKPQEVLFTELYLSRLNEGAGVLSPKYQQALKELADYYMGAQQYDKAEEQLRKLVQIHIKADGPSCLLTGTTLKDLADCLYYQGKLDPAETAYSRAVKIMKATLGTSSEDLAQPEARLAEILNKRGYYPESIELFGDALSLWDRYQMANTAEYALAVSNLADADVNDGKLADAEENLRRAASAWSKFNGLEYRNASTALSRLATVLDKEKKYDEARQAYAEAVTATKKAFGPESLESAQILGTYSQFLFARGAFVPAIFTRLEARSIFSKLKT
jgi:serine/threonine protein kinase